MDGFVIILKDGKKPAVTATGDVVFGDKVDFYLKREDAEFAARTVYAGKPLEVRRATISVDGGLRDHIQAPIAAADAGGA